MKKSIFVYILILFVYNSSYGYTQNKDYVSYVNPYVGNISHLLVPTYPTVHLPNSMLRVYPQRGDFTSDRINGLPLIVASHRGWSCFNLSPYQGNEDGLRPSISFNYDNEKILPYYYKVDLDDQKIKIDFAPSHQSAIYRIKYKDDEPAYLILNSGNGDIEISGNTIKGYQNLWNNTRVYIYMEVDAKPLKKGILSDNKIDTSRSLSQGDNACAVLYFGDKAGTLNVRYGVSFISTEQAEKNLRREIPDFKIEKVIDKGKQIWNEALGKIKIEGGEYNDKVVFYTSLYRCYERPINISEDGRYFSASDGKVHDDEGQAFYTDDWLWDTYRATHPLRVLIDSQVEVDIIQSFLRMAEQSPNNWLPTFPEVNRDSRRMNCNHAIATIADAWVKGLRGFDLAKGYDYGRKSIEEKTLAPWSSKPAGWLDKFYKEKGYIPALAQGEKETVPEVDGFEKRQAIPVTLGTAYDQWCLSQMASFLGKKEEADYYLKCSYNYRNVFNPETGFFHPKDKNGNFIHPFDYRFSGGLGAREYYDENNGWVYRWDVQHNIADLVELMGGAEKFSQNLDDMFNEWLGRSKFEFYAQLPDHTGNVGQFSMGNEPSLHIPYLYNYAGKPWMTQKRIRHLIRQWFRNDLMGVPGDEDGGGLSGFVVFSQLGIYPVTPGSPTYNIGSPFFPHITIQLSNGKTFEVIARNCSADNKYIQSAKLNGKVWNKPWIKHEDIADGGKLELVMGNECNKDWGSDPADVPPSANPMPF
ncbi:GH92 family glycosyl hydrolase [Prevotella sp. 10(H)]|uniref:GH92 family glycosyl hydrolase n=1 Tax=Prevotella sp. 10(H) TaxID=1158294 RepID=UPI0004A6C2A2|nr:GH92 family glycosyl hydrolase [Prevotella sp. 10(H)]